MSLIAAPSVDASSFDRQLLPTQWRPGAIVRTKLYMHASYATPSGARSTKRTMCMRFNLPALLPVPQTKDLMKTDGSPSRQNLYPSYFSYSLSLPSRSGDISLEKDLWLNRSHLASFCEIYTAGKDRSGKGDMGAAI